MQAIISEFTVLGTTPNLKWDKMKDYLTWQYRLDD